MSKLKKVLYAVISGVLVLGAALGFGLGFGLPKNDLDGVSNTDTTSFIKVDEIWTGKAFNKKNLGTLFSLLSFNTSTDISQVATYASSATFRTFNNGKDIVVRLGGLDWQVVYTTENRDGDKCLTLWLSNNYQDAFVGRSQAEGLYHGFYNGGLYSDWSADFYADSYNVTYPSNVYGSSYLRAVTLNNGGAYATGTSSETSATQDSNNVFAPFTIQQEGIYNDLTDFIEVPRNIMYQGAAITPSWSIEFSVGVPSESEHPYQLLNEEAQGYTDAFNYYVHIPNGSSNLQSKNYYYAWLDDRLWLPSLSEVGYSGCNGIWYCFDSQRANYDGQTDIISGRVGLEGTNKNNITNLRNDTWLRSGHYTNGGHVVNLSTLGAQCNAADGWHSLAVRPALHLNLTDAAQYVQTPLTLNLNGGNIDGETDDVQIMIDPGQSSPVFTAPERAGYRFVGWVPSEKKSGYGVSSGHMFNCETNSQPFFNESTSLYIYNNAANGNVKFERMTEPLIHSPYNTHWLRIKNEGTSSPFLGGFTFSAMPNQGDRLYAIIQARIPEGYTLMFASNGTEAATEWLTPNIGTGDWETYAFYMKSNAHDTMYFYLKSRASNGDHDEVYGTTEKPIIWDVSCAVLYDCTNYYSSDEYYKQFLQNYGAEKNTYWLGDEAVTLVALWEKDYWTDYADTEWLGSGTESSPYLISTAEELAGIAYNVNLGRATYANTYFKQTNAISLDEHYWNPIGTDTHSFFGNYNGNNCAITGIKINTNNPTQGLFGKIETATISKIIVRDSLVVSTEQNIAGIVGYSVESTIEYCSNYADVKGDDATGGIVGQLEAGIVINCTNGGNIESDKAGGGIAGAVIYDATIEMCSSQGIIKAQYAGGIAAYVSYIRVDRNIIKKCSSSSTVIGQNKPNEEDYIGGVVGYVSESCYILLQDCAVFGKIMLNNYETTNVGLFVGNVLGICYIDTCTFNGLSDLILKVPYGVKGSEAGVYIYGTYWKNGKYKYYTSGDFSGYTIVSNMNNGLPMQNALYSVAIGGNTSDEVIANLRSKGFSPYTY